MARSAGRWIVFALSLIPAFQSCRVDDDYSMENLNNIDMEMTLFRNGISVPLGSTEKIRLDSLLERSGINDADFSSYLKKDDDGSYHISYTGTYDMSEELSSLNINQFATILPEIDETWSKSAGIAGKDHEISLDIDKLSEEGRLFRKSELAAVAQSMGDGDFEIPETVAMVYDFLPVSRILEPVMLPDGVASIKSVELSPDAAVKVSLSLVNPMIVKGSITPVLEFDTDGTVSFTDGQTLDLSSLVLNENNSYRSSKSFPIKEINIESLSRRHTFVADGKVIISNAVTNKHLITSSGGDMAIKVEVELTGISFTDVAFELEPVEYDIDESISFGFKETDMPEEVKTIKSVTFGDNSVINLDFSTANTGQFKGIDAKLEKLTITFPAGLEVEGEGVSGNKLTIQSSDLLSSLSRKLKLKRMIPGGSESGVSSYSGNITVSGKAAISGVIHTSEIPADPSRDPGITAHLSGKPVISEIVGRSDYSVTVEDTFPMPDLTQLTEGSTIEIPELEAILDINSNLSVPIIGSIGIMDERHALEFPVSKAGETVSAHNSLKIDVNSLFNRKPAPKDITVSMTAGIDPARDCIIRTSDKYSLSADYALNLPVMLGENTSLSLTDTVIVDSKELAEVLTGNAVELSGKIESTLPLGLDITMTLLDSPDGGVTTTVIPLKKPAIVKIDASGTSEFGISLELAGSHEIDELYAIRLDISVNSNGQVLHDSDYIQLWLSATLPNGITINPKEKQ